MKKLLPKNILYVGRNWSTMGKNNTFENLLKFFPGSLSVTNKDLKGFDNRIYRYIKRKTGNSCYSSLSASLELNAFKKSIYNNFKIVHFWYGDHDYYFGYLFRKIFQSKIIVNLFFSLEELEKRMPNKLHLKNADLITCSGKAQIEYLKKFIDAKKLAYLPLGVDTKAFHPSRNKNKRDRNLVICVGNNRRDFKTLQKIYSILKVQRPNVKLKLAGSLQGKEFFSDHPEVEFLPFLNESKFMNLYHEASLLILPLLEGGSSQTLNEALSSGLPVLTNKFPNLIDYTNTDGVMQFTSGDYHGMAHACLKLLNDESELISMSNAARSHVLKYDYSHIKERLIDIYANYLGFEIMEGG